MSHLFRSSFIKGLLDEEHSAILIERQSNPFFITLLVTGLVLATALLWLFFARLDYTVDARGLILPLGGVRDVRSMATGRVIKLYNTIGDSVWSGKVLAELDDPVLAEEWRKQRLLYQLSETKINLERTKLEQEQSNKQAQMELSLAHNQAQTEIVTSLTQQLDKAIQEKQTKGSISLKSQKEQLNTLHKDYQAYNSKIVALKAKGYASESDLINRLSGYESILNSVSEIERQSYQAAIDHTFTMGELGNLNKEIDHLTLERLTIENDYAQLLQQHRVQLSELHLQQQEEREKLLLAERAWWRNSVLIAPYDGKLLSFVTGLGHILTLGDTYAVVAMQPQLGKQLLTLSPHSQSGTITFGINDDEFTVRFDGDSASFYQQVADQLKGYFPDSFDSAIGQSGLLLTSGDQASLSTLTIKDSQLIDRDRLPVFSSLTTIGDNWHNTEQVNVSIVPARNSKLINTAQPMKFLLDHQSQWLHDSLSGEVRTISDYYVTPLELESLIGSKQIVQEAFRDQSGFLVISTLENSSTDNKIPVASLTRNKFIINQQSPIKLIVPFVERRLSGQPDA